MAVIVHRCETCGHTNLEHGLRGCSYSWCRHGRMGMHPPVYGPPVVVPTFDAKGRPVEELHPPGSKLHQWNELCGCDACVELFASVSGELVPA